ncbi:MAG: alpha/beta hydrolase [Halobacteriovoraceae bacterium]|nr:alpha/beta hydrolase [Halobacteriovoraceae bacterium]
MRTLVLLLLLLPTLTFAGIITPEWKNAYHDYVRISVQDQALYPLAHLERKGKTPVLLLHGIGGNHHNYMDLGSELYKMGYDVWALSWTARQDRDMDSLGSKTVRDMVDMVFRATGKKVFLVGHSMGGIISKIYLFGLNKVDQFGNYTIDLDRKEEAAKKIAGFVSLASPNGLETNSLEFYMPFFENLPIAQPYGTADLTKLLKEGRAESDFWIAKFYEYNTLAIRIPGVRGFINSLFYMPYHEVDDFDLGKTTRYGFGKVPFALRKQIRELSDDIQESEGSSPGLYYTEVFLKDKPPVPVAYVSGAEDAIGGSKTIGLEAMLQSAPYLELPKAGHLDPVLGKMRYETAIFINRFILDSLSK